MAERIDIVANPAGGKGASLEALSAVESYLFSAGIEYAVHKTAARGDAVGIVRGLCERGRRKIAVLGGDGTFHEALNGMDFFASRLGFIPAGRGNDFASACSMPLNPVEAVKAIAAGVPAERDFISVGSRRCLNVCGTGLDAQVLRLAASGKGRFAYTSALARSLFHYKPCKIQLIANGTIKAFDCITAAVCNGSRYGGGIRICPPALTDDGFLDLVVVTQPRHIPALFVMPGFVRGRHIGKPYVMHVRCEEVKISTSQVIQLDGEIYDESVLDAKIVKGGLKTFKI